MVGRGSRALLIFVVLGVGAHPATASVEHGGWGDGDIETDGDYEVEAGDSTPGVTPVVGSDGPVGFWASWRTIDGSAPPACLREVGDYFDVASQAEADAIAAGRSLDTDVWVEEQLMYNRSITYRCDDPDRDAVDAQTLVDIVEGQLPRPAPTISGGRAITGNRSWLDLHRPSTHDNEDVFELGATGNRRVAITATATTTIDWGDGTVTEHAGSGGPYRDGEPGPGDITHTYIDTGTPTISVVDTWQLTFDIDGLPTIAATATLDPVTLDVVVTEVRSVRRE